jgi:hypothetical protein
VNAIFSFKLIKGTFPVIGRFGLPSTNPFWQGEAEWTARKAWGGNFTPIDEALRD